MTKEEVKTMDKELTDFYKDREEEFDNALSMFICEIKEKDGRLVAIKVQED